MNERERQAIEEYRREQAWVVQTEEEAEQEERVLRDAAWVLDKTRSYPAWLMEKAYKRYAVPIYVNPEVQGRIDKVLAGYYFDEVAEARKTLFLEEWEPYMEIQAEIDEIVNKLPYEAGVWAMSEEAMKLVELRQRAEKVKANLESINS